MQKVIAAEVDTELQNQEQLAIAHIEAMLQQTQLMLNVYYPFIDHCIIEFTERFSDSSEHSIHNYTRRSRSLLWS